MLAVKVKKSTPRSVWTPRDSGTRPNTRGSKVRISSRVPVLRALRLTWALRMSDLVQRAAVELWAWSVYVELRGSLSASALASVVWPHRLLHLSVGVDFIQSIDRVVWPASLRQLSFEGPFNQPLVGVVWPASLKKLSFVGHFNQPIVGVMWPASLKKLSFVGHFNQPIVGVEWPASLQKL